MAINKKAAEMQGINVKEIDTNASKADVAEQINDAFKEQHIKEEHSCELRDLESIGCNYG